MVMWGKTNRNHMQWSEEWGQNDTFPEKNLHCFHHFKGLSYLFPRNWFSKQHQDKQDVRERKKTNPCTNERKLGFWFPGRGRFKPPLLPNDGSSRIWQSHHQALYQTNLKMIDSLIYISLISVALRHLPGQKTGVGKWRKTGWLSNQALELADK